MPGSYLAGIFGASPVKPLQTHMEKVLKCVQHLEPFFDAVFAKDLVTAEELQGQVVELEQEADELKKDLRMQLPTSLFMPVDRRDVLEVLSMQDRVAGAARGTCGLVIGRQMTFPDPLVEEMDRLVKTSINTCTQAYRAICELDELIETSFGKPERELVSGMLSDLDALESETDDLQQSLHQRLFTIEDDLPPVQVMFLYRVIDRTGAIADRAQRVGSRLQLMLAR